MERDQASKFINDLLKLMLQRKGSDLFITADFPPAIKVDGKVTKVSAQPLSAAHTLALVRAVMNDKQAAEFEHTKECNFAISPAGIGRFRCNAFVQQGKMGMVMRVIPQELPTIDGLGMPFASGPAHDGSCCHVSGVLLDPGLDVEAFRTSLREDGIQTSHHYPAVHLLHWYREHMDGREGTLPRTESASLRQVTLPLYPGMGADRVALVIDGMKRAIARQTVAERA